jgi:hypothetical protein
MFKIVKYLNFTHTGYFVKMPVEEAAYELIMKKTTSPFPDKDPFRLLSHYRDLEKE